MTIKNLFKIYISNATICSLFYLVALFAKKTACDQRLPPSLFEKEFHVILVFVLFICLYVYDCFALMYVWEPHVCLELGL